TRFSRDWSSDVCSSDLKGGGLIKRTWDHLISLRFDGSNDLNNLAFVPAHINSCKNNWEDFQCRRKSPGLIFTIMPKLIDGKRSRSEERRVEKEDTGKRI